MSDDHCVRKFVFWKATCKLWWLPLDYQKFSNVIINDLIQLTQWRRWNTSLISLWIPGCDACSFGRPISQLCMISNAVMNFIYTRSGTICCQDLINLCLASNALMNFLHTQWNISALKVWSTLVNLMQQWEIFAKQQVFPKSSAFETVLVLSVGQYVLFVNLEKIEEFLEWPCT